MLSSQVSLRFLPVESTGTTPSPGRIIVFVTMMQVGIVLMAVQAWVVPMPVRMGDAACNRTGMTVCVMLIIGVTMFMIQRFVAMAVRMHLSHMEPYTESHEEAGHCETQRERFS